jgi:hypothetical protein
MATFNDSAAKLQSDIHHLQELLARLKKQRQEQASAAVVASVPIVETIQPVAATAATPVVEIAASVAIPKYAKPEFANLTPKQRRFVCSVIDKVRKNDGINMANITNPTFGGIPFPKSDFPTFKLWDVIRTYTTLVREEDNIYLPEEKSMKSAKKIITKTLKSIVEFNNDFAKAINEVREENYGEGWGSIIPEDAPMEVSINEVLNEFVDLTQYEIDENDPCASLNRSRFLIDDETGKVSIIPIDA